MNFEVEVNKDERCEHDVEKTKLWIDSCDDVVYLLFHDDSYGWKAHALNHPAGNVTWNGWRGTASGAVAGLVPFSGTVKVTKEEG